MLAGTTVNSKETLAGTTVTIKKKITMCIITRGNIHRNMCCRGWAHVQQGTGTCAAGDGHTQQGTGSCAAGDRHTQQGTGTKPIKPCGQWPITMHEASV